MHAIIYHVTTTEGAQITLTAAQVREAYALRRLTVDSPIWRDGMEDWSTVVRLADEMQLDLSSHIRPYRALHATDAIRLSEGEKPFGAPRWPRLLAISVIAFLGLAVIDAFFGGDKPKLKNLARHTVLEIVKSPATAAIDIQNVTISGDRATISGTVDSQNSYGAIVRANWTLRYKRVSGGWTLENIDYKERK